MTFKQTNLNALIEGWIKDTYYSEFQSNDHTDFSVEYLNGTTNFRFSHSTWYGMIIDTLVTVHDCTQVFRAQTVTMQSQTRLGYKDYGENYYISEGLYKYLNDQVTEEGKKSFISCS